MDFSGVSSSNALYQLLQTSARRLSSSPELGIVQQRIQLALHVVWCVNTCPLTADESNREHRTGEEGAIELTDLGGRNLMVIGSWVPRS